MIGSTATTLSELKQDWSRHVAKLLQAVSACAMDENQSLLPKMSLRTSQAPGPSPLAPPESRNTLSTVDDAQCRDKERIGIEAHLALAPCVQTICKGDSWNTSRKPGASGMARPHSQRGRQANINMRLLMVDTLLAEHVNSPCRYTEGI